MFQHLRRRRRNREVIESLYAFLADEARRAEIYAEGYVPDTPMGRFESLAVQVYLFLRRCRGAADLQPVAQEIVDRFVVDVEASIRELGVGDPSVPKRMRRFTGRFYERVNAYDQALEAGSEEALREALRGRLVFEEMRADAAAHLASLMLEQDRRFASWTSGAILAGERP